MRVTVHGQRTNECTHWSKCIFRRLHYLDYPNGQASELQLQLKAFAKALVEDFKLSLESQRPFKRDKELVRVPSW